MPEFQRMDGAKLPASNTTVVGSRTKMKLVGGRGDTMPIPILVLPQGNAKIEALDVRKPANFTIFVLNILAAGKVTLQAGSNPQKPAAGPIVFDAVARLSLPVEKSNAGLFARLFIAETRSPGHPDYTNATDAETAMTMMHAVVLNRLAKPSHLYDSKGAKSVADVIRAGGEFKGFGDYPNLTSGIADLIKDTLAIANDGGDSRSPKYRAFVQAALKIAAMEKPDPAYKELYWWRTEGSGRPTPSSVEFKTLMANTFYTMKPGTR